LTRHVVRSGRPSPHGLKPPALIGLLYCPTGRRIFVFRQLQPIATGLGFTVLEDHLKQAIEKDTQTLLLEQRWAQKRRTGKLSDKQIKAQNEVVRIDRRLDRTLSSLRDAAVAQRRGAEEDDKEVIEMVDTLLDAIFPNGVVAVTKQTFPEELTSVQEILRKLATDELSLLVKELGLTRIVDRLKKLADKYEAAQKTAGTLDFGEVRAARQKGQNLLLRAVAKIVGAYDEPDGDSAKHRAALMLPVLKQNEAIRAHFIKARRPAPDIDPNTGEEQDTEIDEEIPVGAPGEGEK
jgi:hypothetical protein